MAKQKQFVPKAGKCDILHGIIIGGEQIKNLEKRNVGEVTAQKIINKLDAVKEKTSDATLKEKAEQAITLLKKFSPKSTISDVERQRVYRQVCG